jgi:putative ABC transport system substrate-binding protein
MRRREFITLLGGAAAACPLFAHAQQLAMPVIGHLGIASAQGYSTQVAAFRQGLAETGYVDGRNVAIEYRWADYQSDRLPGLAADLVRRKVAVITALGTPEVIAAKAATSTIPIVFYTGGNPVAEGLVASLAQPGGNLTGVTSLTVGVVQKRLELLQELVPTATVVALLVNPANPVLTETQSRDLQAAAGILGLELEVLRASTDRDLDTAFATLVQLRAGGLIIGIDAFFTSRIDQIAALALRRMVPTIYQSREFAAAGGLMSYGGNITDQYRMVGSYTGRILKGEKPADLPVQQLTKVELFINLKTAKALGITVPLPLSGRADELFE